MSEIAAESQHFEQVVDGLNDVAGLRLFMLAAMGNNCDLSSIYALMKLSPCA